jgi:SAM-dependent methyltransferase
MIQQSLSHTAIKKEVKKRYAGLVLSEGPSSCCGSDSTCLEPTEKMKGNLVKSAGYSDDELRKLPQESVENSFGCGNPLAFSEVQPGQTVLDIGSGAGIDCFIAAERVGPQGKVIGLDMTPEMIAKAEGNARAGGFSQVEFPLGEAEAMPLDDETVDWVISNCVINLSPVKPKVFREISRVLKPGGRFSISDIVLGNDLPVWIADSIYAYTGCVAGAIKESDYLTGLRNAGLTDVEVESRIVYDESALTGFVKNIKLPFEQMRLDELLTELEGQIWSAKIKGYKPTSQTPLRHWNFLMQLR